MIIRSQDKNKITDDLNLHIDSIEVGAIERVSIKNKKIGVIGTYSTEEKAIKVLDMIQETYGKHYYGRHYFICHFLSHKSTPILAGVYKMWLCSVLFESYGCISVFP